MGTKILSPCEIEKVICENIKNQNVIFVFPTSISVTTWAQWCVCNFDKTGVKTVFLDKFIAWDDFKKQFIVAKEKNKHKIPSLLRKIFVYNLISENAQMSLQEKPLLKSVITPKFAQEGYSFADWISSNLPSLKMWYERFEKYKISNPNLVDNEDLDYEYIFKRYSEFLGDEMYEPSWCTPDFSQTEKTFLIFYPQQFSDYEEYSQILEQNENIILYTLPQNLSKPIIYEYPDARKELRHTVLQIRELVENSNGKISYNQIAFNAPKLESYLPYVEREFTKYCVPFVVRMGKSYTTNNAGSIFENIKSCKDNNFSYDSVRALLLNDYIPWKEKSLNESLIRLGCNFHCICNYEESRQNDVWIKSLKEDNHNERELILYERLRKSVESLCDAKTFKAINQAWNIFKNDFLEINEFSKEADEILSSCIVVLDELIKIEEDYIFEKELIVYKPYDFFLNELRNKTYTPQQNSPGVNIFDYKVASCSAFKYNFVINCNQNAISISQKQLSFLNNQKREVLGIKDTDSATNIHIELYRKFDTETEQNTIFSFSEESFDGFSIAHTYFEVKQNSCDFLEDKDFIKKEKNWFLNEEEIPKSLFFSQKEQFEKWKFTSDYSKLKNQNYEIFPNLKEKIDWILNENRSKTDESYIKITQTDLKNFFPCPRNWVLKSILQLKDDTLDANLFDVFDQGNINHKAMELLFDEFKNRYQKIPNCIDGSFGDLQSEIQDLVSSVVEKSIHSKSQKFSNSPLAVEVLESQKKLFEQIIFSFLKRFCAPFSSKSFGGCKILETEKWLSWKNVLKDYGLGGQIDCVLCDDNLNIILIDYKTGSVPKISSCQMNKDLGILEDFQCAEYISLFDNQSLSSTKVSKMAFSSIKYDDCNVVVDLEPAPRSSAQTPEEYKNTLALFSEYTDIFYEKLKNQELMPLTNKKNGKFNYVNIFEDCKKCNFRSVCRSCFTVAGHSLSCGEKND